VAVGAAAALAVAGCGLPIQGSATEVPDDEVPFGLLEVGPPIVVPPTPGPTVALHLVDGQQLVAVERPVPPDGEGAAGDVAAAIGALQEGPTAEEEQRGLDSALAAEEALVAGVAVQAGVAVVDLGEPFTEIRPDRQLLALGQIVLTLTSRPGVGQVRFRLQERAVEVPRADGSLTADPVSADDYRSLLAP
jgi:spore germination protein GerM